jgi:hypothetical protein
MHKYSSILKIFGLSIGLGLTSIFFALEAFVPGMYGIHWLGMYTFMPGLAVYLLGVLIAKKPKLDTNGNIAQTKPLSKASRIILTALLLLFALPILFNILFVLVSAIK